MVGDNEAPPPPPPTPQTTPSNHKFPDHSKEGLFILTTANFSVKFDGTNYPIWRRQVFGLLRGLRLHGLIDGTIDVTDSTDPENSRWYDQDALIQQAMITAFTPAVISSADTCRDIWTTLEAIYANASPARLLNLTERFQQARKHPNQSVSDFLHHLKSLSDEIQKLGQSVPDAAFTLAAINGVQDAYPQIASFMRMAKQAYTFDELHETFVSCEESEHRRERLLAQPVTANAATLSQPSAANLAHWQSIPIPSSMPAISGSPNSGASLLGAGPTGFNRSNGNRFNNSRNRNNNRNQNQNNNRSSNSNRTSNRSGLECQICHKIGHSADKCWHRYQPQANMAHSGQGDMLLDSGASNHVTNDLSRLNLVSDYNGPDSLVIGNGKGLRIKHVGTLKLPSYPHLSLPNTLHVPTVHSTLISVAKLCRDNDVLIEFHPFHCLVKDRKTGETLFQGSNRGDVYCIPESPLLQVNSNNKMSISDWHCRLGHPALPITQRVLNKLGFSIPTSQNKTICASCASNKSHRLPFSNFTLTSSAPLDLLFTDVWGPSPITSSDGFRYYVIFVDHFTRYVWLYTLTYKSDVLPTFQKFQKIVENYFNKKIKVIHSDGGGEYIKLGQYLSSQGISHLISPPYTPQRNSLAERRHRHIVETGKTLLNHASLPPKYWSYALQTAVYLINRQPTPILNYLSPFELLHKTKPNYNKLRIFGCLCYPWLYPYTNHKLDPRSRPCVFLGFDNQSDSYFCLDPGTDKIFRSRDVAFDETIFPFSQNSPSPPNNQNDFLLSSTFSPPLTGIAGQTTPHLDQSQTQGMISSSIISLTSSPQIRPISPFPLHYTRRPPSHAQNTSAGPAQIPPQAQTDKHPHQPTCSNPDRQTSPPATQPAHHPGPAIPIYNPNTPWPRTHSAHYHPYPAINQTHSHQHPSHANPEQSQNPQPSHQIPFK